MNRKDRCNREIQVIERRKSSSSRRKEGGGGRREEVLFNVSDKLTVGNQRLQWLKCLHFSQTICFFLVISVKISIRRTRRFGSGT